MTDKTRRLLRIIFGAVGVLAVLFGVATAALVIILRSPSLPPGIVKRALLGSLLYLSIGSVCTYAFVRLGHQNSAEE